MKSGSQTDNQQLAPSMSQSILDRKWPIVITLCILSLTILELINTKNLLPNISGYSFLRTMDSLMPSIGYAGLFVLLFVENTPLPFPGMLFLPLAGYYVFVGRMSFTGILAISTIASLAGSLIIFLLILKLGAPRIYWGASKLGISQQSLARNEIRLCGKYGPALILTSHFIPIYGPTIVLPAGALRTNPLRFVALTLIGSLGSAAVYLLVGYSLGPILVSNGQILTALITQNILYALAIVCAAYTAYYSMRKLKQKRAKTNFLRKSETE